MVSNFGFSADRLNIYFHFFTWKNLFFVERKHVPRQRTANEWNICCRLHELTEMLQLHRQLFHGKRHPDWNSILVDISMVRMSDANICFVQTHPMNGFAEKNFFVLSSFSLFFDSMLSCCSITSIPMKMDVYWRHGAHFSTINRFMLCLFCVCAWFEMNVAQK